MAEAAGRPRRVMVDRDGPVLVEGPVEVVAEDGTVTAADRFVVAICTCRRSATYPWCDTSHRRRGPRPGTPADRDDGHDAEHRDHRDRDRRAQQDHDDRHDRHDCGGQDRHDDEGAP
ncbi:CDGSH iron-sulfur domain-containing protein [Streptomyces sp. HPF1205]|uniref:CDGSH iron-sulfur domain-containing protein n=1 Tax=Streptomyces sp. HPF1205 TaxID=2873262 RepID=UPI0035ABC715